MSARTAIVAAAAIAVTASCAPDPPSAVVGVIVDACDPADEIGSGMIVADGLVLTSAHVVAGARSIAVLQNGATSDATIVAFDPEMDLAYLAIDDQRTGPMPEPMTVASEHVAEGDRGVAYVVRDREPVTLPVRVRRRINIRTEDIYIDGETLRPGFELDADIRPGDSGGAVMVGGEVVGVIWARSRRFDDRAYAIDPVRAGDLVGEQLRNGELGDDIDLARCY